VHATPSPLLAGLKCASERLEKGRRGSTATKKEERGTLSSFYRAHPATSMAAGSLLGGLALWHGAGHLLRSTHAKPSVPGLHLQITRTPVTRASAPHSTRAPLPELVVENGKLRPTSFEI
jgi:hypothetical protein